MRIGESQRQASRENLLDSVRNEEEELEEIDTRTVLPQDNVMVSKLKYRVMKVLIHLLDGHSPDDDMYYEFRRKISPETLRMNLAYFHFFFSKYHNYSYDLGLFFRYVSEHTDTNMSPLLIELAFYIYFFLRKL